MSDYYTPPDDVVGGTRARSGKINDMIQATEDGFDAVETEISAARSGETDLEAKIDAMDAVSASIISEVTNAREGEDTLLLNLTSIHDDISALTILGETGLPDQTGNDDKFLQTDGTTTSWVTFDPTEALPDQDTHATHVLRTNGTIASWSAETVEIPDQTDNSGKFLSTDGSDVSWELSLPDQTDNSGKFLTTDGTDASWALVLPDQTDNSGKALITNGTTTSWSDVGLGGSTETSSALDITLTSTSTKTQLISMTATARKVALPDGSGLEEGGSWFWIANEGAYSFSITNSSGTVITTLLPGNLGVIFLADESTDDWRVYKMSADTTPTFTVAEQQTFISDSVESLAILDTVSNEMAVIGYSYGSTTVVQTLEKTDTNSSNAIYGSATTVQNLVSPSALEYLFVADDSANVLFYTLETDGSIADVGTGTILVPIETSFVSGGTVAGMNACCKLNSTQIAVNTERDGYDSYICIGNKNLSDGTWDGPASPGAITDSDLVYDMIYWSEDYIFVSFLDDATRKCTICYRSGVSMVLNQTQVDATSLPTTTKYIRLTDTEILALYYSSGMKARILSRSSATHTTVTINAEQSLSALNPDHFTMIRIDNTTVGFIYNVNGSLYINTLAVTGTTVELVDNATEIYNGDVSYLEAVLLDSDELYVVYADAEESDYGKYNVITIS